MPGFMYDGNSDYDPAHNIGGKRDIHRVHRWRIDLIVGEGSPDLRMFAKTLTLPGVSFDSESGPGGSIDYKYASKANFEDVTVVFYDVDGLYKKLEEMKAKVWTPDNGLGLANDYKAESSFILQTPEDEWLKFTLIGSWIKALSHEQLTYESSEAKIVSVTLSYDWYEFKTVPNQGRCLGPASGGPVVTEGGDSAPRGLTREQTEADFRKLQESR